MYEIDAACAKLCGAIVRAEKEGAADIAEEMRKEFRVLENLLQTSEVVGTGFRRAHAELMREILLFQIKFWR